MILGSEFSNGEPLLSGTYHCIWLQFIKKIAGNFVFKKCKPRCASICVAGIQVKYWGASIFSLGSIFLNSKKRRYALGKFKDFL